MMNEIVDIIKTHQECLCENEEEEQDLILEYITEDKLTLDIIYTTDGYVYFQLVNQVELLYTSSSYLTSFNKCFQILYHSYRGV